MLKLAIKALEYIILKISYTKIICITFEGFLFTRFLILHNKLSLSSFFPSLSLDHQFPSLSCFYKTPQLQADTAYLPGTTCPRNYTIRQNLGPNIKRKKNCISLDTRCIIMSPLQSVACWCRMKWSLNSMIRCTHSWDSKVCYSVQKSYMYVQLIFKIIYSSAFVGDLRAF